MGNCFYYFAAIVALLQIFSNITVSYKIDGTISFINSELVANCVTERGKLETIEYNDISYLSLDHQLLMEVVDEILNLNLSFIKHEQYYYFYDMDTLASCSIGSYYCNSVQIKIIIYHNNQMYERILRYEPMET